MRLSAPWHRKAAPARVRASSETSHRQIEDALETAIAGLRGVIAHVRSTQALTDLSREVSSLAESSSSRSAASDTDALPNLDQRLASIADGIAALRAENRRRAAQNFDTVIGVLSEKIELLEAAQKAAPNATFPGASQPLQPRPEPHICKFGSIERGIAELVRTVREARADTECCLARLTETPQAPGDAAARTQPSAVLRQSSSGVSDQPGTATQTSARSESIRRAFPKVMLGLALTLAFTAALQSALPYLAPRPVAENAKPPAKVADRGPRLDSTTPGAQASIPDLSAAANLPLAIGARLIASAAAGDPGAAYEVGVRLTQHLGPAGTEQAVSWLERAAKAGLAPAQLVLGGIYEKGIGVAKDPQLARVYYLAAAQRGNIKAMHNLAVLYAQGLGGKVDYGVAAEWFRKAAMHGVSDSQFNLAVLYERGAGMERDPMQACKLFALAARRGDPVAAKKRDEIAQELDAGQRASVKAAVEAFVPQPEADGASNVRPPPGGWDQTPAPPDRSAARQLAGFAAVEEALAQRMR